MKEQQIQKKIIDYLTKQGYVVINMIKTNHNGVPDLLCLQGHGHHFWIEVKKPGGKLSKLQIYRIKKLEEHGDVVLVPFSYEEFIFLYNNYVSTKM